MLVSSSVTQSLYKGIYEPDKLVEYMKNPSYLVVMHGHNIIVIVVSTFVGQ